ncbi:MAG: M1 family aminopeptidase, partial [bacterium]|nr:M1 family aminopeptidase [bacterium]
MAAVYEVLLTAQERSFTIDYEGSIDHPLADIGKERARGFRTTAGTISEEGVYLSGYSLWYPRFEGRLETFVLDLELPGGWDGVSQGRRTAHHREESITRVRWESPEPQEEIYLIAGRFVETSEPAGGIEAMVFLRSPDEALARKYLDVTARYVAMYEKLIGPYPYSKFALVENFWETGYGMPSFTLLGPRVIRFPFILHSSYPHEILHNWWGNGVYPDYGKGNWSEGLTAYLSDHLIKEQQGQGEAYRQTTLQKYADYVGKERDFPLTDFRSRHSTSSEAIGYGKSLMFFHMLRLEAGDAAFTRGLRDFYSTYRFRSASFDEIRTSFEKVLKRDLSALFGQWVTRPGAPVLHVSGARSWKGDQGYLLEFVVEQTQRDKPFRLQVPLAVTIAGQDRAEQRTVTVDKQRAKIRLELPARPLRIDVDPEFDLFRRLHRMEIPPALSQTFGAEKMLILLPASADKATLEGYRFLAQAFAESGPESVEVRLDSEVTELPGDRAVTLFGWDNAFVPTAEAALGDCDVVIDGAAVVVNQKRVARG